MKTSKVFVADDKSESPSRTDNSTRVETSKGTFDHVEDSWIGELSTSYWLDMRTPFSVTQEVLKKEDGTVGGGLIHLTTEQAKWLVIQLEDFIKNGKT